MSRAEHEALRLGVGLCRQDHVVVVRVCGDDAFELVDAVVPRPLFLRDGQLLQALLLHDDGSIFADLTVCVDDLDFLLLAEGPTADALVAWLTARIEPGWDARVVDLGLTHALLGVHGPYAWELLAEAVGPEVVGVGYLRSFALYEEDALCFRAGKTGEFGYELLVPRSRVDAVWERLIALGQEFDAVELSLDTLDEAALENGFFTMRAGAAHLTPIELQLLWRIAWDRQAPGMDALRARRHAATHRITWFTAEAPADDPRVLHQAPSPLRGGVVGLVLLPLADAEPDRALGALRTVAPPLLRNRSLFIDAQRHSFAGRALDAFPELVP